MIKISIKITCWHEIKIIYKLYNNDTASNKGEDKLSVANANNITNDASLDQAGDEARC